MAQTPDSPDYEKREKDLFILEPNWKINLNPDPWAEGGILRPKDWKNNPYKGKYELLVTEWGDEQPQNLFNPYTKNRLSALLDQIKRWGEPADPLLSPENP